MELKNKLKARDTERNLDVRWFKEDRDDPEEKQKTESLLRSQSVIFDRLRRIIEEEFNQSIKDSEKTEFVGNWALMEANRHGARKALRKIYSILP